jgi:hypothetical protein
MAFTKRLACILFICVCTLGSVRAAEKDLWKYPCDVYMSSACMRLPNDMSVSYHVPADFGIYTVQSSGKDILSVYVGMAPQLPAGVPSIKLDSSIATMSGFLERRGDLIRADIVIASKSREVDTVHVFTSYSEDQRAAVAAIVSSLRACQMRGKEDLRCPQESPWGKAMEDWINTVAP